MADPYRPIACGLHDELQLRAMRRIAVTLRYRGDAGGDAPEGESSVRQRAGRVVDVRTRDGAEYLVLDDGAEIRLDRLVEVDGIHFGDAC